MLFQYRRLMILLHVLKLFYLIEICFIDLNNVMVVNTVGMRYIDAIQRNSVLFFCYRIVQWGVFTRGRNNKSS